MAIISFNQRGSFDNTESFLKAMDKFDVRKAIERHAQDGVAALASATPRDTGSTAASWDYRIVYDDRGVTVEWTNSNVNKGFPVAIMLQYGHGTGTGGYVYGQDYINPSIRPIFDRISDAVWKVVTSA